MSWLQRLASNSLQFSQAGKAGIQLCAEVRAMGTASREQFKSMVRSKKRAREHQLSR